ncbi:MAG: PD40 domain-containing protein [Bacteroides sp.]|nr:PD40 domain-containing protein [Bacteroides sp.]
MKKYIFFLSVLFCIGTLSAQTLNQAKKLFDSGNFEKAKVAFSNFVKRSPNSAEYNYYYGASLYETGEKEASVPYLEKSAKRNYIGAFRYLGKVYADLYRYDKAIENYETHIEWLMEKNRDSEQAEAELSELRHKARMFKSVEKVAVIDSFVIDKKAFLNAFKLSASSGKIMLNENADGTIYENEMGNKRIFSEKKDNLMQLFTQEKLIDGWGEKEMIESLSEDCNINYPFLMGDGTTLYFASDGEGTLGGYDIYVTRYDSEDNVYLRPSNIGMPFNSTANDYLYAVDELNNLGWFVTDRFQPENTVCVYVFVPNETKQNYNYETTDPEIIKDVATLRNIRSTWTDEEQVRNARQRLAALKYSDKKEEKKISFSFIIDDSATYTDWSDFGSKEAQSTYRQLIQKEKDLNQLIHNLETKREQYINENGLGKKKLEPSILDLEKRIPQLMEEVEKLTYEVRRLEIEKLRK